VTNPDNEGFVASLIIGETAGGSIPQAVNIGATALLAIPASTPIPPAVAA
jgi:hypothetical protein